MRDFGGETGMPWGPPFTLGHENAGWVHALGEGVTDVEVGQPVAVYGSWGCGRCARCQIGIETYCENPLAAPVIGGGCGLGLDGGMAEFMLVPSARHLVPLPDGLDPVVAAPLTDAGLTPYHAIRRSWPKLGPTSVAAVIGIGGLGHIAVQIIKATTAARVIAIDTRQSALDLAERLGADACVVAGETAAVTVRGETGGWGADAVFDFVGSDATLQLAASVTRMMGDLTIVGIAGGTLPVSFFTIPYEVSIQSTYWGTRPELAEVLELGARGLVRPIIKRVSLDEAVAAYKEMEEETSEGRAVVVPNAR
jgi:propanol-preferring alcohol dehydrogenase